MPKLKVSVGTGVNGSTRTHTVEISKEDVTDEESLQDILQDTINDLIFVDYEIIDD